MKKPIQFGKYYLLDRVNVGGMAEVFKAKAFGVEGFERLLAVKRILPNIAEDEEFITMFIDEAKIAVQLNHANIAQIFDLGKVEDSYFIALEFVFGRDLRGIFDRCKQKPSADGSMAMPIAQACFIIMKACEGLDYAHNKKDAQARELHLVHRDVSPQNILISYEGEVKLIDFGIAKAAGKASKTQQGILKGKFGYMSPEQVRGLPLDRRSDIFSLGIVLYELLTGERLFVGESDFSTLEKVRNVEILPPSTYNRRINDELERIVMKALAKDVDDRYQNAIDLHDDLQAFMYTAGEFYSRKDLAAWMKRVFAAEIEAEAAKLETYRTMTPPTSDGRSAPIPVPVNAQQERARRNSGQIAVAPPPIPDAVRRAPASPQQAASEQANTNPNKSGQKRPSGGHAVGAMPATVDLRGANIPHVNGNGRPANGGGPPAAVAGPHAKTLIPHDLGWDDEELATNIYDGPPDASANVVDDKPDLSNVELAADGAPVPHPSVGSAQDDGGPDTNRVPKNGTLVLGDKPFELPLPNPSPVNRNGMAARPEIPPLEPRPQQRSRVGIYLVAGLVSVVMGGAAVWFFVFSSRPGELALTSEPPGELQVVIDNKRVQFDGRPLSLEAGPHMVTVQREGFVPRNEVVDVVSGETVQKHLTLEPLAVVSATGFKLLSNPPGAQVILDGKALKEMTPVQVSAVEPGKHKLEVKSAQGTWSQEVTIESGKMIEIKATLANVMVPPMPTSSSAGSDKADKADKSDKSDKADKKPTPPPSVEAKAPPKRADAEPKRDAEPRRADAEPKRDEPKRGDEPKRADAEPKRSSDDNPAPRRVAKKAPNVPVVDDEPPPPPTRTKVAAATPERPAASSGEGYLRLNSKPWTNISVDGKDSGLHTPQTHLKLGSGSHRITLTNPQFNVKETFSVEIKAGETETVIKDLRTQGADAD